MKISDILKAVFSAIRDGKAEEKTKNERVSSKIIENTFSDCYDFEKRDILLGGAGGLSVRMYFIDGLISAASAGELILKPLANEVCFTAVTGEKEAAELMMGGAVYSCTANLRHFAEDVIKDILNGCCAVVLDGIKTAVTFEVKSTEKRAVDQPKEEKVVKGSKDAFVETIKTNSALVRKKLKNKNLKIRNITVGRETNTTAALLYIKNFTNTDIVAEAERRVKSIDIDGMLTSANIEECIADSPKSPFPQLINTERPDKFCLNLLEGRVGILVDGLPIGYLAPGTFSQFLKVPEDNAYHFIIASCITVLRYAAFLITLLLPAFYVAIVMYHQEMIPTKLMQSIIDAKQSVPFPTAFEVLAMLIAFELLQEAGLRLPAPIGETVSIIGALIVGQSAVEAKVVSPVVVIVVALAGIAGYTMPNQDMSSALRICRFLLVLMAIWLGVFGLAIGSAVLLYHLCTLESFGVPYMTPFAGTGGRHMLRALIRDPMTKSSLREPALKTQNGKSGTEK